ncbi:MAG TPA: HAMP domain-containing sensor histidine kinase [Trebonia sp.]
MMRRPKALLKRLLHAQLRLRAMAGVVAITLVAVVAFDVAAVATMRRYLLAQTDSNLHVALTLTVPRLPALLGAQASAGPQAHAVDGQLLRERPSRYFVPAGAFDMTFLPLRGREVALQVAANGTTGGAGWQLSPKTAKVAARPGAHTVAAADGRARLRVESVQLRGGSLIAGTSLDQVDKTIDQVESIVVLGSIAVVLLIGVGVFLVLRRGLRPIESMAAQADRITAGDLSDRVTPQSPRSEVGRLGSALNGMLGRIEADVCEREASQERMRRFFADASHELRTPLASLRANAELCQQGALTSQDQVDEVMCRISAETRRMGQLVDDMLRLARLGQHPGHAREPVDVTALVSACAERVRIADPARTWQVRVAGGLVATGDEELLRRAVDNLLTNVLVHTPAGTAASITVSAGTVSAGADQVVIEVSDDGPGVPPDKLPHIFERFYRAAGSNRPGSGLGLAIVAEIAAAHGGAAAAAAAAPHGLRVTVSLPARRDHAGQAVAALAAQRSWR